MDDRTRDLERAWRVDRTWASWLVWARAVERQGEPWARALVFHATRSAIRDARADRLRDNGGALAPYRVALLARDLQRADWVSARHAVIKLSRRGQVPEGLAGLPFPVRVVLDRTRADLAERQVDREATRRARERERERVERIRAQTPRRVSITDPSGVTVEVLDFPDRISGFLENAREMGRAFISSAESLRAVEALARAIGAAGEILSPPPGGGRDGRPGA